MIDQMLRAADPAAALRPDADSQHARQIRDFIVTTPRGAKHANARWSWPQRAAVGAALAGAAAVATVAIELPTSQGKLLPATAAYAVTPQEHGEVRAVVRWRELNDPARLERALRHAGVPARILTGTYRKATSAQLPACAKPNFGRPYDRRAVTWDPTGKDSDINGIIIRPKYFPAHATFVIEVLYKPHTMHVNSISSFMAIGRVPSCAAN